MSLIYEVYPRVDGNFRQIAEKVEKYIHNLKPDFLLLGPIFKSGGIDGGYDVVSYYEIDPGFGGIEDFRFLISVCSKHNIKLALDLPINHTSTYHPWFQKSQKMDKQYKDYYLWTDKKNNWQSFFGGSACEYCSARNEYYIHLFAKEQADLNYNSPAVIEEMEKITEHWIAQGVGGFRADMGNVIYKKNLRNSFCPFFKGFPKYLQMEKAANILQKIFKKQNYLVLTEIAGGPFLSRNCLENLFIVSSSFYDSTALDSFDSLLSNKFSPNQRKISYRRFFKNWVKKSTITGIAGVLENHDFPRIISRLGKEKPASPYAAAMLLFALPFRTISIYRGQEVGEENPKLPNKISEFKDIESKKKYQEGIKIGVSDEKMMRIIKRFSRDNARCPFDWEKIEEQTKDVDSVLNFYKNLIDFWRNNLEKTFIPKVKILKIKQQSLKFKVTNDKGVKYLIFIDLSGKQRSYIASAGEILIRTPNF